MVWAARGTGKRGVAFTIQYNKKGRRRRRLAICLVGEAGRGAGSWESNMAAAALRE